MSVSLAVSNLVREARNIETFSKTVLFGRIAVFFPNELAEAVGTAKLDEVRLCCIRLAVKQGWYELLNIKELRTVCLKRKMKVHNLSKTILISRLKDYDRESKENG